MRIFLDDTFGTDDNDDFFDEWAMAAAQKDYERELHAHPDCRDPDHPGCWRCEPEDFGIGTGDDEEDDENYVDE